ncbi:MAG: hypothetical protein WBD83_05075, partial [Xanthobacteraceae bacterium]
YRLIMLSNGRTAFIDQCFQEETLHVGSGYRSHATVTMGDIEVRLAAQVYRLHPIPFLLQRRQ